MAKKAILCFIAFILIAAPVAYADAPRIISVQGRLLDSFGDKITDPTDFTFRIYDAEVAGNLLWTEPWTGASAITPDTYGVFSVMLGSSFPLNLEFGDPYWLEVEIGGQIMAPRYEMGSAGYALSVADDSITNAKITNNAVTGSKIANGAVTNSKIANNAVTGLKISDGTIGSADINDAQVQRRVSSNCNGEVMVGINQDGTVVCEDDDTGTGTIGGSGTATQIAFFTGPSDISSDTRLYWDNTNKRLGVGTTSPVTELEVVDPTNANAVISVDSGATIGQYSAIDFFDRGVNEWGLGKDPTNRFYIDEFGVGNHLVILPGGNTGLGMNPAFRLDVNGDVRWSGMLQGGSVPWARVSGFTGDTTSDTIADDNVISSAEVSFNYAGSASKGGSATTAVALAADGANCPAGQYPLGVDASGNAQGCTVDQTGGVGGADTDWVISGVDMYSNVSGDIGIGIMDPESRFHVRGNTPAAAPLDARITVENTNAASKKSEVCFNRPDTVAGGWCIGTDFWSQNDDDFYIWGGGADGGVDQGRFYIDENGNVGINTSNPQANFQVNGEPAPSTKPTARFKGDFIVVEDTSPEINFVDSNDARYWRIHNSAGDFVLEYTSNNGGSWTRRIIFDQDGQMGIGLGAAEPTYQLQLSANSAAKPVSNAWTVVSDERLKKDIQPFTDGLNVITKINPVSYKLNGKAGTPENAEGISIIAQDVQDVAPYTVSTYKAKLEETDMSETELLDFDSSPLLFVLINAVKEQNNQIKSLQEEIALLKGNN